jgi:tetratricopeptide (TPR) repeat protein
VPGDSSLSRSDAVQGALLVAVTLAVYARACSYGFVNYDDVSYVYENRHVLSGLTWDGVWWALTTTEMVNWHPLTWLSFQLDATLYTNRPWGFHLTNIILHAANTALLFGAFRRMTGEIWRSAFLAALFALHPLHVESVAWVSERKDVLSGFFWMLCLWCYAAYVGRPGMGRFLLVALVFGVGLTAKSMLVTLPCVLLLLDFWPLQRLASGTRAMWLLLEKLPLFSLAAASSVITVIAQRSINGALLPTKGAERIENVLSGYWAYLIKTIFPIDLVAFYPGGRPQIGVVISVLLVLGGVTLTVLRLRRRHPYLLVGWLWYVVTLLPVSGIIEIRGGHAMADRYTYIPLVGIFLMLGWGLADLGAWLCVTRLAGAVGGVAIATCAALAWVQIGYWQDSLALWTHALDSGAESFAVRWNLGMALKEKGKLDAAYAQLAAALRSNPDEPDVHCSAGMLAASQGRLDLAVHHYSEALRISPHHVHAHVNLGAAFVMLNRLEDAVFQFESILKEDPANVDAHYNLGQAYRQEGRPEDEIRELAEAVRLDPRNAKAQHQLGTSLLLRGNPGEALAHYLEAVHLQPDLFDAKLNAGLALALTGKPREALQQYQEIVASQAAFGKAYYFIAHALREQGDREASGPLFKQGLELDPYWIESARQTAWGLATNPDPRQRYGALAVYLSRQVCEATGYERAELVDTLAAALAEVERFDDAEAMERKALELFATAGMAKQLNGAKERLAIYHAQRPFRMSAHKPPKGSGVPVARDGSD